MHSYLALGDSYTIGEAVPTHQTYPFLLAEKLNANGVALRQPVVVAKTGWTVEEMMQTARKQESQNQYDLVSLLIGVNNQYRKMPLSGYATAFEEALAFALERAGGVRKRVFVLSIPDYGVTPFAKNLNPDRIATEIDRFNQTNEQISKRYGVMYANITPISRRAATQPELTAHDQLHPSGKMYAQWVEFIWKDVKALL